MHKISKISSKELYAQTIKDNTKELTAQNKQSNINEASYAR